MANWHRIVVFLMHHGRGQNGQTNSLHLVALTVIYWQQSFNSHISTKAILFASILIMWYLLAMFTFYCLIMFIKHISDVQAQCFNLIECLKHCQAL